MRERELVSGVCGRAEVVATVEVRSSDGVGKVSDLWTMDLLVARYRMFTVPLWDQIPFCLTFRHAKWQIRSSDLVLRLFFR